MNSIAANRLRWSGATAAAFAAVGVPPRGGEHGCIQRSRGTRGQRGQVLIIVLLGIVLLAGLIFYVVNSGDQVTRKVAMQNSADSVAIAGASWMARSMNVIGMNNVSQTRMLAAVPILDAFPLSTKMAHEETEAWVAALDGQLRRGVTDSYLRDGLQSLRDRISKQRDILAPLDRYFNESGFDMATVTTWRIRGRSGAPPHGELWRAAESLDELNQATATSAGVLSAINGQRYGEANEAEVAFIVPVVPTLPFKRETWTEFERPVKNGLIPDRVHPQRLGPYDRLFKWRHYRYRDVRVRDRLVPGQTGHGPIRGANRNVGAGDRTRGSGAVGSTSNPNPHWTYRTVGRILEGYTVYGPFEWMMGRITGWSHGGWSEEHTYYAGQLGDTFFHEYQRDLATIKLGYMWGSQNAQYIHYPQYRTNYQECRQLAARGTVQIARTMFYVVEIRSKYPEGSPNYLSQGTFVTNGELPIATWYRGWEDPEKWEENPAVERTGEWIWKDSWDYETTEDRDIGIGARVDAAGQPVWQQVYMYSHYVFCGIDVGGPVEVTNPANFDDRRDLPAPILMDTALAGDYDMSLPHHDLGVRREVFSYLGVATQRDDPKVWGGAFTSGNPFRGISAIGQAEVFNTTSWDLWTQDWKAKLVPVTGWSDWLAKMDATADAAAETNGAIAPEDVRHVHDYFSRYEQTMADQMLNH